MSKAKMGAIVQFCGHDVSFIADIYEIEGVNVVRASGPVDTNHAKTKPTAKNAAMRPAGKCTHSVVDFPNNGFWRPDLGVFVVPAAQVKELKL